MPRRGAKLWRRLPLSHDTAARADDLYQEHTPVLHPQELGVEYGDFVVFVETLDTLAQPRKYEDYNMDLFSQQATKICLLKISDSENGRQPLTMDTIEDIPKGAEAQIVGSMTRLPTGPEFLRRTGNVVHQDDFVVEPIYTDPIASAMLMEENTIPDMPESLVTSTPQVQSDVEAQRTSSGATPGVVQAPATATRTFMRANTSPSVQMPPFMPQCWSTRLDPMDPPLLYPGAVQWPQDHMLQNYYGQFGNMPEHDQVQAYIPEFSRYTPDKYGSPIKPPMVTRTVLTTSVAKLAEQAKERNKNPKEYRTVLYDPYRVENKASLRGEAAAYFQPQLEIPDPTKLAVEPVLRHPAMQAFEDSDLSSISLEHSSPDTNWQAMPAQTIRLAPPSLSQRYTPQNFHGPFFTADNESPLRTQPRGVRTGKDHDQEVQDWWWSGNRFARQEEYYQTLQATNKSAVQADVRFDVSRMLIPVLENLAAYVEGPSDQRRDYFSRWVRAPEWCCDRSAEGAKSFFDKDWGCPPARIGRDPRYQRPQHEPKYVHRWGSIGSRGGRFGRG